MSARDELIEQVAAVIRPYVSALDYGLAIELGVPSPDRIAAAALADADLLVTPQPREAETLGPEDLQFEYFHVTGDPMNQGPRGVRVTHIPTRRVVTSTSHRSQLQNKAEALRQLRGDE